MHNVRCVNTSYCYLNIGYNHVIVGLAFYCSKTDGYTSFTIMKMSVTLIYVIYYNIQSFTLLLRSQKGPISTRQETSHLQKLYSTSLKDSSYRICREQLLTKQSLLQHLAFFLLVFLQSTVILAKDCEESNSPTPRKLTFLLDWNFF